MNTALTRLTRALGASKLISTSNAKVSAGLQLAHAAAILNCPSFLFVIADEEHLYAVEDAMQQLHHASISNNISMLQETGCFGGLINVLLRVRELSAAGSVAASVYASMLPFVVDCLRSVLPQDGGILCTVKGVRLVLHISRL